MALRFYFDVHVPRRIAVALRVRTVDVLSAQEDGRDRTSDPDLLDRATDLARVLVSFDRDLLIEAARRQRGGIAFPGLVSAHPEDVTVGRLISDLELMARALEPEEMRDRVIFLPL